METNYLMFGGKINIFQFIVFKKMKYIFSAIIFNREMNKMKTKYWRFENETGNFYRTI